LEEKVRSLEILFFWFLAHSLQRYNSIRKYLTCSQKLNGHKHRYRNEQMNGTLKQKMMSRKCIVFLCTDNHIHNRDLYDAIYSTVQIYVIQ